MNRFENQIAPIVGEGLYSEGIRILQVNLGLRCNQVCAHCHVDASPERSELMEWPVMARVIELAESNKTGMIDLTEGARAAEKLGPALNRRRRRPGLGLARR